MIVPLLLFLVTALLLYAYLKYRHSYWRRRKIAHIKPSFPKGNVTEWRHSLHIKDIVDEVYQRYKDSGLYAGFYFFFAPAVVALDLDFIKDVLIKDFSEFADRGQFFNEIDDPLTGNLFHMDGPKWRSLRSRISPTFSSGKMKFMFSTVQATSKLLIETLREEIGNSSKTIEISYLMKRFSADVIGSCAFGLNCESLRNPESEFIRQADRVASERVHGRLVVHLIESYPRMARKLRMRKLPRDSEEFYMRIVGETEQYRRANNVQRNDFMDMLLKMKHNGELSSHEVVAQAFIFITAGFETSSTTMGFALYELAHNPGIQEKACAEVVATMQRHNNELTYEAYSELRYLQQILSETMRRYPVAATLSRKSKSPYTPHDPKFFIEKGTLVVIPVHSIHHDPDLYPDPYRFDPERFSAEETEKRHPCAWLPFGTGPRSCVGLRFGRMQAVLGLAMLLKEFRFSVSPLTQKRIEFVPERTLLTAVGGIHLNVEPL